MLGKKVYPTLPAVDIKRATKFYEEKLGFRVIAEDPGPGVMFQASGGCMFYIYQRAATKADHTVASFDVDDIESEVRELKAKGVRVEPPITAVWGGKELMFNDPDGNKVLLL